MFVYVAEYVAPFVQKLEKISCMSSFQISLVADAASLVLLMQGGGRCLNSVFVFIDGYISVMNVELNIKEMLELGKKVSQASCRSQTNGDELSVSSR